MIIIIVHKLPKFSIQDLRTQPKKPGFFTKILRCYPLMF